MISLAKTGGFRSVQQRAQRCAAVGVLLAARQHRADASAGSREAN
jgi:hypothetical protein